MDEKQLRARFREITPLPEEPSAYFELDLQTHHIPVSELQWTRLRPEGVRNAAVLMRSASAGNTPKRRPIQLRRIAGGGWSIVDGNSTAAVARLSGWATIPCHILPPED